MNNMLPLKIYKALKSNLLNNDLLDSNNISRKTIEYNLISNDFLSIINEMVKNSDFSCKAILELCKDMIESVSGSKCNDWLYYIYQFTVSKSFPSSVDIVFDNNLNKGAIIYLEASKVFSKYEHIIAPDNFYCKYPLTFISNEEEFNSRFREEYKKFKKCFNNLYVYEMMKLNQELTGHNTLDHISGVHYIAVYIARQLKQIGLPVDLGIVSGSAAGHDIGKFGCKGEELKRVPYLHYYYTDLWFKNHNIPYIGHIATNHSTWDLELENLPLESLILIYSDFRVKNKKVNNSNEMHIFSLSEAFNIVLNKLDNVNETKEKRYKRVYAKLKDFEDYMIDLGISVDLNQTTNKKNNIKYYSLMQGNEIINNIKYFSIEHNINLMNKLIDEKSLNNILDMARSENNWNNLRGYLQIFEEYSTYLTQRQKVITISFLYELLVHKDEDIRKQSAELIGTLIALFDEEYRKEIPQNASIQNPAITSFKLFKKYLTLFLNPDHKMIQVHRDWIKYNLKVMISSVFKNSRKEKIAKYVDILLNFYNESQNYDQSPQFYNIQTVKYIPLNHISNKSFEKLCDYVVDMLNNTNIEIRLSALEAAYYLISNKKNSNFENKLKNVLCINPVSSFPAENFLKYKIAKEINISREIFHKIQLSRIKDNKNISEIFLTNLKSATNWVSKKIHIHLLLEEAIKNPEKTGIHTAMHFCNLIKVSAIESVRNHAGEALVKMMPYLSLDKRNDVAVELLRGLEIQGYQFTRYIPQYLGQIILYLPPTELDEIIDDFSEKVKQSNTQIIFLILRTVGITIQNYPKYRSNFKEDEKDYDNRLIKMLGILLNGLINYNQHIKHEAFRIIGKEVFDTQKLSLEQKNKIFNLICKKILTLLPKREENQLLFLNNSVSLNYIYRFISDYNFFKGKINISQNNKIAFFPGTFDPFSLSHKEIAKEIRDLGFEVYLAVDEFSWSKRTQPHKLRRNIISMSIADELGIYLFPEDIPINISNPKDLKMLKDLFPNADVYIVVGSDVILNASSYKKAIEEHSIHNFPHIIFNRKSISSSENDDIEIKKALNKIKGNIINLSLPPQYEDISSTQIRRYIDQNRDISELIDPLSQKYIYEQGIYLREPQYKSLVQIKSLDIQVIEYIDDDIASSLTKTFFDGSNEMFQCLKKVNSIPNSRIMIIKDINKNTILYFSVFHWLRSTMIFSQFKNKNISEYIRKNASGRIIVIDGIFANKNIKIDNPYQIILNQTLTYCIAKDYNYAIFKNYFPVSTPFELQETLRCFGFEMLSFKSENKNVFVVNMNRPCTLNLDLENVLKDSLGYNEQIRKTIKQTRKKLQKSISQLYPGNLVLSFDQEILYDILIGKICKTNEVPTKQLKPRKLGKYMCVPFGTILNGRIIPNTVTKSMHTEKMYAPDINSFDIGPFPYYMDLNNQIKMLNSFDRPVILVDDLLNKGYRIKAIMPLLKKWKIEIKKIIVGILTGKGKELMEINNMEVDSAYYIPNLNVWFNENDLYPYIGGDTVWRGFFPERNILPSINFILPYTSPVFIKNTSNEKIFNLSKVCIENSIDIFTAIESEYQRINEKNLTLKDLGKVIQNPRYPDRGKHIKYDLNLKVSEYLKNDLEQLKRMEDIVIRKS